MNLQLTDEQHLLVRSAADFLDAEYSFQQRHASICHRDACLPAIWSHFAELGWLGLCISEDGGGLGGTCLDTGLLMAAMGPHLVVEPYFACVAQAARLLDASGDRRHMALLADIVAGDKRMALAHDELGCEPWAPRTLRALRMGEDWQLDGRKLLVSGAPGADFIMVSATDMSGGTQLFLLPKDTLGLRLHQTQRMDGSQAADLCLERATLPEQARIASSRPIEALLQRVLAEGMVALCWEASGTMQAALTQTASYTQQRQQFGQSLSRFQVVQHRLAEMAVCCEESRAACELATLRMDAPGCTPDTAQAMASLAKSKVGRAARTVAYEAVQLHGGMGVCEELPVAAMFRKLTSFTQALGSTAAHSQWYGQSMLASGQWRTSRTLEDMGALA